MPAQDSADVCPHCGVTLPAAPDGYCFSCGEALDDLDGAGANPRRGGQYTPDLSGKAGCLRLGGIGLLACAGLYAVTGGSTVEVAPPPFTGLVCLAGTTMCLIDRRLEIR